MGIFNQVPKDQLRLSRSCAMLAPGFRTAWGSPRYAPDATEKRPGTQGILIDKDFQVLIIYRFEYATSD